MPRKYIRKTTRGEWSEASMTAALDAVKNGMAYKKASREFSVPLMSLKRRAKQKNKIALGPVKYLGGRKTVFTEGQEIELVNHLKDMEVRMYGLTRKEILSLAYQLAVKNNIPHPFNGEKAGNDWLRGFRQRHPDITLRCPESTSTARARAFNKPVVDKFFCTLKDVQNGKNFPPHRIYNVDETSICTVPTKNTKVFAGTGRKQVARVTSAERGVTTTAVICMSASGTFIPPMFIFRRIRMKIELMDGAPPGSVWACNSSGWMKLEIFNQWFNHFLHHTKPSKEDPVLLILDGHLSHTKNLEVILKARDNQVTIVCLPPHCTHKLQPLDVSVMYPLSVYHNQSLEKWMNNNPGRPVTVFQIAKIFGEAYLKAAIPTNAINGFAKTGICPCDPDVFTEADFIAATTTENEIDEEDSSQLERVPSDTELLHSADTEHQNELIEDPGPSQLESPRVRLDAQQPSPSDLEGPGPSQLESPRVSLDAQQPSPSDLEGPGPTQLESPRVSLDAQQPSPTDLEGPGPSQLESPRVSLDAQELSLTDLSQFHREGTPHKTLSPVIDKPFPVRSPLSPLPSTSRAVNSSESARDGIISEYFEVTPAQLKPLPQIVGKRSTLKRKSAYTTILTSTPYKDYLQDENGKKSEKENKKNQKKQNNKKAGPKNKGKGKGIGKGQSKKRKKTSYVASESSEEDDTECLYCTEKFSSDNKGEGWIKCCACGKWGHEACAGIDSDDPDEYICDMCNTAPAKKRLNL